jgi:hypothetical protein
MIDSVAAVGVLATGVFLFLLGVAALLMPARARWFLLGFASTPRLHALELGVRLIVGAALWLQAPAMRFALAFTIAAGILLGTTALMALLPWRWHHRFASTTVPRALRWLPLLGIASIGLGGLVLHALFAGSAAG